MAISTTSNWQTTFYYEQELRSKYMNQVLNSTLTPGIYNANLALVAENSTNSTDRNGLYLFIKKGSTFVFSNNYVYKVDSTGTSGRIEKDTRSIGSYIIKSVAAKDMFVQLIHPGSSTKPTYILGNRKNSSLQVSQKSCFYIAASIAYSENEDTKYDDPVFSCLVVPEAYEIATGDRQPVWKNYFFQDLDFNSPEDTRYKIPDGFGLSINPADSDYKRLLDVAWLNLGRIERIGDQNKNYGGGNWNDEYKSFVEDHIWISRGLPDYGHSFIFKNNANSNLILSPDCKNVYLNLALTRVNDSFFRQEVDYKQIHKIGPYIISDSRSSEGDINSVEAIHNFKITDSTEALIDSLRDQGASDKYVVLDISFLGIRNSINTIDTQPLEDIFQNQEDPSSSANLKGFEIFNEQLVVKIPPECNQTTSLKGNDIPNLFNPTKHYLHSFVDDTDIVSRMMDYGFLPQDNSEIVQQEILNLIVNKNFIPRLIDKMRLEGRFNKSDCIKVSPLFIAFREIKDIKSTNITFSDNVSNPERIHPANFLSFLDIQSDTLDLPEFPIVSNVFNTISVLDDSKQVSGYTVNSNS